MDKGNQERKSELGEVVKMKDSKILDLQFVVMDDIVFKNIPFEDRINTKLTLSDYDWMNYVFETEFRTKNQGRLKVEIKYYGSKESEMNVKRIDTIGVFEYTYFFETEMFEEYVFRFMRKHLIQWKNQEVFYGGDIVLAFYNDILKKGRMHKKKVGTVGSVK